MSYKDLLVHVDPSKQCAARLAVAAALARRFGASLTGFYATPPVGVSPFMSDQFPPGLLEEADARTAQARDVAEAGFEAATARLEPKAAWLEATGDAAELLMLEARLADLVILGQPDPDEALPGIGSGLPEHVIMGSGRPALLVPYAGRFETLGERVLVAWNGSAQAARAVADALPLLARAKHVEVLAIGAEEGYPGTREAPGQDVARHLAKHGIKAEAHHLKAGDVAIGDLLLSRAAEQALDLIVMGVYGHSRVRELVLGGVSRLIFERMTVPIFMAH